MIGQDSSHSCCISHTWNMQDSEGKIPLDWVRMDLSENVVRKRDAYEREGEKERDHQECLLYISPDHTGSQIKIVFYQKERKPKYLKSRNG